MNLFFRKLAENELHQNGKVIRKQGRIQGTQKTEIQHRMAQGMSRIMVKKIPGWQLCSEQAPGQEVQLGAGQKAPGKVSSNMMN